MRGIAIDVGEVAATTAGHQYFLADLVGAFQDKDASAPVAGGDGAHQACSAGAKNYYIIVAHRGSIARVRLRLDLCVGG